MRNHGHTHRLAGARSDSPLADWFGGCAGLGSRKWGAWLTGCTEGRSHAGRLGGERRARSHPHKRPTAGVDAQGRVQLPRKEEH